MLTPWTLPGPLKYLETIRENISQGRSIALARPRLLAPGWEPALERAVSNSGRMLYRIHEDTPRIDDPQRLIERLIFHRESGPVLDGSMFVGACKDASRLGLLPVLTVAFRDESLFQVWSDYAERIEAWQRIALERERFLVLLERDGLPSDIPGKRDVRYANLGWPWPFQAIDMAVWCHLCRQTTDGVCGRLATHLGSAIAGYDPEICQRLAEQDLDALLEPSLVLKEYAELRGWDASTPCDPWLGTEGILNGKMIPHPAWEVATRVKDPEYLRRIWSAQVSVLLPEVEEQRCKFIGRYQKSLILPWVTKEESIRITEPRQCEVGHLYAMVTGKSPDGRRMHVGSEDRAWIKCLWDCRNDLSHLELVNRVLIDRIERYSRWL